MVLPQKSQEIGIKFSIIDCSNIVKRWSGAHFVSFLFYYYCNYSHCASAPVTEWEWEGEKSGKKVSSVLKKQKLSRLKLLVLLPKALVCYHYYQTFARQTKNNSECLVQTCVLARPVCPPKYLKKCDIKFLLFWIVSFV